MVRCIAMSLPRYSLILCLLLIPGCTHPPATKEPMDTILYTRNDTPTTDLVVLLPGIKDRASDYAKHGFIDAVRNRRLPVDLIAVDAHLGYYARRNVIERLQLDVITPARARGYRRIWLVGISLGGFGSLLYASRHTADIQGMILLSPFLGSGEVIDEIYEAGGIKNWRPGAKSQEQVTRSLWIWLKQYEDANNHLPELYLGYGRDDKFAPENALLASVVPKTHLYIVPGGHDWATWEKLWDIVLDEKIFAQPK